MIGSDSILYQKGKHLDHVVVIKYLPFVGDPKRAMVEYPSHGMNTNVIHNTCQVSLLAVSLILDLSVLTEIAQRISLLEKGSEQEIFTVVKSLEQGAVCYWVGSLVSFHQGRLPRCIVAGLV